MILTYVIDKSDESDDNQTHDCNEYIALSRLNQNRLLIRQLDRKLTIPDGPARVVSFEKRHSLSRHILAREYVGARCSHVTKFDSITDCNR